MSGEPSGGGPRKAPLLLGRNCNDGVVERSARLHFDEYDSASAPRDDVDFAALRAIAPIENYRV